MALAELPPIGMPHGLFMPMLFMPIIGLNIVPDIAWALAMLPNMRRRSSREDSSTVSSSRDSSSSARRRPENAEARAEDIPPLELAWAWAEDIPPWELAMAWAELPPIAMPIIGLPMPIIGLPIPIIGLPMPIIGLLPIMPI